MSKTKSMPSLIFIALCVCISIMYLPLHKYIFPPMVIKEVKPLTPYVANGIPEITEDRYEVVRAFVGLEPSLKHKVKNYLEDGKIDENEMEFLRDDFKLLRDANSNKRLEEVKNKLKE